jgi:hypothetical protein
MQQSSVLKRPEDDAVMIKYTKLEQFFHDLRYWVQILGAPFEIITYSQPACLVEAR